MQWIMTSKYKLRQNGENIRDQDYIIFKNVNEPNQKLIWEDNRTTHLNPDLSPSIKPEISWKIDIFQRANAGKVMNISLGDYISVVHVERGSDLICYVDNPDTYQSSFARIGRVSRDYFYEDNTDSFKAFYRPTSEMNKSEDTCGVTGLQIWQLLPSDKIKLDYATDACCVSLKHVLTGLYLSVVSSNDSMNDITSPESSSFKIFLDKSNTLPIGSPRYTHTNIYILYI
jgi:hypothetical protein